MLGTIKDTIGGFLAGYFVNRAISHQQKNKASYVKSEYERAFKLCPHHCGAHYNYGRWLFIKGDYEKAIHHFTQAIESKQWLFLGSFKKNSRFMRAHARFNLDDFKGAEKEFKNIIENGSPDWECYSLLGVSLFELGKPDEGITFLESGVNKSPKTPRAHYLYAFCMMKIEDYSKSMELAQKVLSIDEPG